MRALRGVLTCEPSFGQCFRLLRLLAADESIDDLLYKAKTALDSHLISLDEFLKVRQAVRASRVHDECLSLALSAHACTHVAGSVDEVLVSRAVFGGTPSSEAARID